MRAELLDEVRVGRQQLVLVSVVLTLATTYVCEHPRPGPKLRETVLATRVVESVLDAARASVGMHGVHG